MTPKKYKYIIADDTAVKIGLKVARDYGNNDETLLDVKSLAHLLC